MKRCIIHIGHAKTATTYLQHFLHLNEQSFRRSGYWVPSDFRDLGYHNYNDLANKGAIFSGNLAPLFLAFVEKANRKTSGIVEYIFSTEMNNIILSSELVFYYPSVISCIASAAKDRGYAAHLVCYLPRQDKAVISSYLQNIRNHGFSGTVFDFLEKTSRLKYFRYYDVMEDIRSCGAIDKMSVRTFDKRFLFRGDIAADFLRVIGYESHAETLFLPTKEINSGLPLEYYEVLRCLNNLNREDLIEVIRQRKVDITDEDRKKIVSYYYTESLQNCLKGRYISGNANLVSQFIRPTSGIEEEFWFSVSEATGKVSLDPVVMAECISPFLIGSLRQ